MNIEQYRALKAEGNLDSTPVEQPTPPEQPVEGSTPPTQITPETPPVPTEVQTAETNPTPPNQVILDGKPITVEELREWQQGYMRNIDYTQKTQDIANQQRELESALHIYQTLQTDPELAQQVFTKAQLQMPTEEQQKLTAIEEQLGELLFEKEVSDLKAKYQDFDVDEAVVIANDKGFTSLEDAYLLAKAQKGIAQPQAQPIDEASIREQIKAELMAELQLQKDTSSIISTNNGNVPPVQSQSPELTPQQLKIAQAMNLSPAEYLKWQD